VDDAVLVRLFQRLRDLLRDLERFVHGDRPALQAFRELFALDQLHGEEVGGRAAGERGGLEPVHVGDVRVVEGRQQLASRSKRARRSPSCANAAGSTLIATSRPSLVSFAR